MNTRCREQSSSYLFMALFAVPGARNTCQDGQGARMDISSLNAFSERNAFNGFNQAEYDRSDWAPRVRPAPQVR